MRRIVSALTAQIRVIGLGLSAHMAHGFRSLGSYGSWIGSHSSDTAQI